MRHNQQQGKDVELGELSSEAQRNALSSRGTGVSASERADGNMVEPEVGAVREQRMGVDRLTSTIFAW